MVDPLKLMCIFAHPDDETFSTGGVLARYAAEGVETYLISATRGEQGWTGKMEENPGLEALGMLREAELRCAAGVLGIREVAFLDVIDGHVSQADPAEIIPKIAGHLRRIRPQVVITMDPQGVTGHPDHIAVGQFALAAIVAAASGSQPGFGYPPHAVSKLYMVAESQATITGFSEAFGGPIGMTVDGEERQASPWRSWEISARIDASAYWDRVVQALACHRSQVKDPDVFARMPEKYSPDVWGIRTYYRAFSLANGGREIEDDLFAGLRAGA